MVVKGAVLVLPILFAGLVVAAQTQTQGKTDPAAAAKAAQELQAKGKALAEKECTGCHSMDVAASLRYSKTEWETVVKSMMDKGSSLKKEDVSPVVEYLAATYGIKQLAEEACGGCHDYTPVAEQRLSKADWDSLVRGMVDRGAALNKDQITIVVDYLAATYPNN
jgi:cytochrome c5